MRKVVSKYDEDTQGKVVFYLDLHRRHWSEVTYAEAYEAINKLIFVSPDFKVAEATFKRLVKENEIIFKDMGPKQLKESKKSVGDVAKLAKIVDGLFTDLEDLLSMPGGCVGANGLRDDLRKLMK